MVSSILRATWLVLLAMLGAETVRAAPDDAAAAESPWRLGVGLGYGQRSNPLVDADDIPIVLDLDIAWFGKRWFFDNGDLGFTFADTERYTLSLMGRFNSDRVFFSLTNSKFVVISNAEGEPVSLEVEVPDRDYAFEVGVEFLTDGAWGSLQLSAFHDVSGTYEGYELYANYAYSFWRGRWNFQPSFGLIWNSDERNNYYWGVRPDEANEVFPAYDANAGLNLSARLLVGYQLTRNWSVVGAGEVEHLASEIADSPIVADRNLVAFFLGFRYQY